MLRSKWRQMGALAMAFGSVAACSGADSGSDAVNGLAAVVSVNAEPAGSNCDSGGQKLEYGTDSNRNGQLDADEVAGSSFVCNGGAGADGADGLHGADSTDGADALVDVTEEAAGANCEAGGYKIEAGTDTNGDGTLAAAEVTSSRYVCDGADGADGSDGFDTVIGMALEGPGENCAWGGQRIDHGLDTDRSGGLEDAEVTSSTHLCNGADGLQTLVYAAAEVAGDNCAEGGQKIQYGTDADRSGTLDDAEFAATIYACNGATGAVGLSTLVVVSDEAAGLNCAAGGERVDHGVDADRSGTLEATEIHGTRYVCNGIDGYTALVRITEEPAGSTCPSGGQLVESGLDNGDGAGTERDGVLHDEEVDASAAICSGGSGIRVEDSNGVVLGRLSTLGGGGYYSYSYYTHVLSDTGYLYPLYMPNLMVQASTIYFSNSDCTGTSYSYFGDQYANLYNTIGNFAVVNNGAYYKSVPGTNVTHSFASYRQTNGTCSGYSGSSTFHEVVPSTAAEVGIPTATLKSPLIFK